MKWKTIVIALVVLVPLRTGLANVDLGDGSARNSPYAAFTVLIESGKYEQAVKRIESALKDNPNDADLLNFLAFSHRKLQHYQVALKYYLEALNLEPEHLGANEYLGELYLQLGQLEKARERLDVLDKACLFGCEEYDELKAAISDYQL
ncbi:MAG: tetratricopeptide (TPR) repeat protein [Planctomycetota bacterium]|jgi:tetratricopeptide (TPR) repeat protein